MSIASPDHGERVPTAARRGGRPSLALVDDRLALAEPAQAPSADWQAALAQVAAGLKVTIMPVQEQSAGLRQRIKWPWGAGAASAGPVFAPWLSHACTAFQDPRGLRDLFPARWVASYLWDPCCNSRLLRGSAADVMLISPHPAACRIDEESSTPLPGIRLLQDMIGAAHAEGRCRIAIIGHERSRTVVTRQLLPARAMLPDAPLDLEVLAIEEVLARLTGDPTCWDAIIVVPELRSLIFTLLAQLTGIGGAWPMAWHGKGLALVCGETGAPAGPNCALDAALLVQALALAARDGGKVSAARRLAEAWARLRDRGLVTPTRGSPNPYSTQTSDPAFIAELCRSAELTGRPVAAWRAMAAGSVDNSPAPIRPPAPLALVSNR